jgi:predicted PurR-regulated permease PerM
MRARSIQNASFVVLLLLVTVGFVLVVWDFLRPVFWSAVLAVLFSPVQRRWLRLVGGRASLASVLSVLTVVFIALLPVGFVGYSIVREAMALYEGIAEEGIGLAAMGDWLRDNAPTVEGWMRRLGINLDRLQQQASEAFMGASQAIGAWALRIGQNVARVVILTLVMLYVLFFFFRDGREILERVIAAVPLGEGRERHLLQRFVEVSRGTVKGTLLIGLIQGTLGGLAFWALGIQAPILWGAVMVVLSILPAVGAALVWVPAAIVLISSGRWVAGLVLILFGTLVIGLIDNFLRPILVGRDAKMPDYMILISTLGGLWLFGITGFVLGPIIAALFMVMWETFGREFARTESGVTLTGAENAREEP